MTYSEKLFNLAKNITEQMIPIQNIEAIFVAGSVGRNIADEYSDIELFIVWNTSTTPEMRRSILDKIQYETIVSEEDEGGGEWVLSILIDKLKIDIYHWEKRVIDSLYNSVIEEHDTSISKQLSISSLLDSKVIEGHDFINQSKQRFLNYPAELAAKCIKINTFFESWGLRNALIARNDFVALENLVNEIILQLLRLLFAINSVYLRSHNFKWIDFQISIIPIKPSTLGDDLEFIAKNINTEGIERLETLLLDTFELVKKYKPEIDIKDDLTLLNYTRTPNAI